jgi:hypothetical protein
MLERIQSNGFKLESEIPVAPAVTSKVMEYKQKTEGSFNDMGDRYVVVKSKHGTHVVQHDLIETKKGVIRIGRRENFLKRKTSHASKEPKTITLVSHNKGSDSQLVEYLNYPQEKKPEKKYDKRKALSDVLITTKVFTPIKNVTARGRDVLRQGICRSNKQLSGSKERKGYGSLPSRDDLVRIWGESHVSFSEKCQNIEWDKVSGTSFFVRHGPNYVENRTKAASKESLYNPAFVCAFQSRTSRTKSSLLNMMPLSYSEVFPSGMLPDLNDERVPHLLVINIQVPFEQASFFSKAKDGKGGEISLCFVPSNKFCEESNSLFTSTNGGGKTGSSSAATALFTQWCENCKNSNEWRAKLKCMGTVHNVEGTSPPKSYKGKPVLVGDNCAIFKGVTSGGVRYLEVSINGKPMNLILILSNHIVLTNNELSASMVFLHKKICINNVTKA